MGRVRSTPRSHGKNSAGIMLASFNYYGPSTGTIGVGIGVGLFILLALYFAQSALKGFFLGAISWAVIAAVVYGSGGGDMVGFAQIFFGIVYGVAGGVAGLLAGLLGKAMNPPPPSPKGPTDDSPAQ